MSESNGTIKEGEYHPAADSAMAWIKWFIVEKPSRWMQLRRRWLPLLFLATASRDLSLYNGEISWE
jgi:hypothetical protein